MKRQTLLVIILTTASSLLLGLRSSQPDPAFAVNVAYAQNSPSALSTDAVVGKGTPASCTEAAFDTALAEVQASEDGEISFNCGGAATIIFTQQKVIDTQLIIINGDNKITLSGGNSTRLFHVISGSLELRHITLTNGFSGAGHGGVILADQNTGVWVISSTIQNSRTNSGFGGGAILSFTTGPNAAVTIEDSTIQGNTAGYGAVNTVGHLVVRSSIFQDNEALSEGGAFSVGGPTEIFDTIIQSNKAHIDGGGINATETATIDMRGGALEDNLAEDDGGAVDNTGYLFLTNVSIKNNRAWDDGGALGNRGSAILYGSTFFNNKADATGGAVYNVGALTVKNSTFSSNDTDEEGGSIYNNGAASLYNVTLVGHGGRAKEVIYNSINSELLTISNTIIYSFGSLGERNCSEGPPDSVTYNLFSDNSCIIGVAAGDKEGNLYGDALLAPLADNGGPTRTNMIAAESPAIDAGQCIADYDQRGVSRPQGLACDIGAVERQPLVSYNLFLPLALNE